MPGRLRQFEAEGYLRLIFVSVKELYGIFTRYLLSVIIRFGRGCCLVLDFYIELLFWEKI